METVKPASAGLSAARLERITDALHRWVDDRQAAGFVALVGRRGKVGYFEAAGYRDLEAGAPMERDAIFRIFSMSKPITAAAVMMLLEEGRFRLDDPIAAFIPEFSQTKVFHRRDPRGHAACRPRAPDHHPTPADPHVRADLPGSTTQDA